MLFLTNLESNILQNRKIERPPTTHLTNHSNKTNKTCGALMEKQGWTHLRYSSMDSISGWHVDLSYFFIFFLVNIVSVSLQFRKNTDELSTFLKSQCFKEVYFLKSKFIVGKDNWWKEYFRTKKRVPPLIPVTKKRWCTTGISDQKGMTPPLMYMNKKGWYYHLYQWPRGMMLVSAMASPFSWSKIVFSSTIFPYILFAF